jgi:uroporphyrinogen decarboxylase
MLKNSPKENMIAALECRQPADFVPVWEIEFQAWNNVSGKHIIFGQEFTRLSQKEQELVINNNAEIIIETCKQLHFSALTVINSYWEVAPGHPSYYWLPEEWKEKQNNLLLRCCEQEGIAAAIVCGALLHMPEASNYEEFCYKLIDNPEEIDEMVKDMFEYGINLSKKYADAGYNIAISTSDIADNKGPFYNPEQMNRWFYPYLHKWAEEIKIMGMYSVLHTDGNVYPLLEDLANSPLNALQAIDPVAGMCIKKTKEQVEGRLCLCGNIETGLLVTGPKETIYNDTRKLLSECKSGGGLVLGASNAVVHETPAENYLQMIKAWEEYGKYE